MTRHDRLMKALAEIKTICAKNEDATLGCGGKCSFLMEKDKNGFRPCEVVQFTHMDSHTCLDAPEEWGEEESERNTQS